MLKKVVVLGPESTGKSTLCEHLAEHFQTNWVKEYAREYLIKNGTSYKYEDLYSIAKGQLASEDKLIPGDQQSIKNERVLFIDTDLYVVKVWSEFMFNKCDNRILSEIAARKYDLYLLCNTDVDWVKDSLREYPDLAVREKLFHYYKDTMINQNVPWVEISGNYKERMEKAIVAVKAILNNYIY